MDEISQQEQLLYIVSRYIESPEGAEVARRLSHGTLILEDGTAIRIPKGGVILNRLVFGQRLLADAEAYSIQVRGAVLQEFPEVVQWEFVRNLQSVQWGILPSEGLTPLIPLPAFEKQQEETTTLPLPTPTPSSEGE